MPALRLDQRTEFKLEPIHVERTLSLFPVRSRPQSRNIHVSVTDHSGVGTSVFQHAGTQAAWFYAETRRRAAMTSFPSGDDDGRPVGNALRQLWHDPALGYVVEQHDDVQFSGDTTSISANRSIYIASAYIASAGSLLREPLERADWHDRMEHFADARQAPYCPPLSCACGCRSRCRSSPIWRNQEVMARAAWIGSG